MTNKGAKERKWRVIRIFDEYRVLINAGTSDGIGEGDLLKIVGETEEIIDPETKKKLGKLEKVKAKVRAIQVQANMCVAESAQTYKTTGLIPILEPKEYLEKLPVDPESVSGGWVEEKIRIGDQVKRDEKSQE